MPRTRALVLAGLCALAVAGASRPATAAGTGCSLTASPATFTAAVAQAGAGQTVCLTAGDYGTWSGTSKAITVTAAPGAAPQMRVGFGPGDSGFTLAGMSGMGGAINGGAHDLTIRDSAFASPIKIEATNAGILLDHNSHDWNAVYDGTDNAKIFVWNDTGSFSGVTVENSTIRNGNLDGVHLGGGAGIDVVGNVFADLCDTGTNHTDNIQFEGGKGGRIAGNYVHEPQHCDTQGITSYDGDTHGITIEDNVVDIPRDWGIELYSDRDSIVRHNTVVHHPRAYSTFHSGSGQIDIDRKPQDPAGSGTQVYDNLTGGVDFTNGSTGIAHHNADASRAIYVGPADAYTGFRLAPDSPVGLHAASDGLDAGVRFARPATPPQVGAPATTPSRLVAAYAFEERGGGLAGDSSGGGHTGTLHGATRTRAGRHGRAVSLGARGYVSVPGAPALQLTGAVTLEAWVRPAASGRGRHAVIAGRGYALSTSGAGGRPAARVRTPRRHDLLARRRVPLRRWSHVALTYDGHVLRLYVDGRLAAARAVKGALRPGSGALRIGGGFTGRIDDVRVWRVALSSAALRRHARG